MYSINVDTLATERKINVSDYIGIMSHTSHPHVLADGTVYNLGMTVTKTGPMYNIICFPRGDAMFEDSYICASVPSRWKFYPGYMHTFGITDSYFIIVEQPLSISVPKMIKCQLRNKPMASNFKWFADHNTCIYLVSRKTGLLVHTFETEAFFYLHIINSYETNDHVVLDICCYKDPAMLDCMYIESMENMQSNPDYATMFRGKPMRFVLPLCKQLPVAIEKKSHPLLSRSRTLTNLFAKLNVGKPMLTKSYSEHHSVQYSSLDDIGDNVQERSFNEKNGMNDLQTNLVQLDNTTAEAYVMGKIVYCKPEILCDLGCETPRIYYESYAGKRYRYFYAISSDVDADNPGTVSIFLYFFEYLCHHHTFIYYLLQLIKVDIDNKTKKTWCEINCYPSEPIFLPNPYAEVFPYARSPLILTLTINIYILGRR